MIQQSLLGMYLKEIKLISQRDICTPVSIAALFTIPKIQKQPKCPLKDEQVKKVGYIYTMEYPAIKKEGNPAIWDNMDTSGGHVLSEMSQIEKDKYCVVSLLCGIFKKKKPVLQKQNRMVVAGAEGEGNGEVKVKEYKLHKKQQF